jgi:proton-translocating NADH-quinone oxidoreductase chain M
LVVPGASSILATPIFMNNFLDKDAMFGISFLSIVFLPFFGSVFLFLFNIPDQIAKKFGFVVSLFTFFIAILFWFHFDNSYASFQFVVSAAWVSYLNFNFLFGVDGISLLFVLLTTFLVPLCLLFSWNTATTFRLNPAKYFAVFLIIETFILVVFTTLDLFVFYIFFEAVLLPIFLIIGVWGSRERKAKASFYLFLYTVIGSLFILLGILFVFFETGTTNYLVLCDYTFSLIHQKFLWLAFFFSFSVKVPIVPIHLWLPEAHVEAPTEGSVILAGILLKLGTYGFIRFSLCLFPQASFFFKPLVFLISVVAVIYTSITALRQSDMKRVIAYASIAHINITLLGLFSFSIIGVEGSVLQMLSHGIVSGALFFCVGVLYDRHHTKLIFYYSGLVQTIPVFVCFFLLFTMANIGLPGTSSFVGEFMILLGAFSVNTAAAFFSATSLVFGGCYALWLFNRLSYGNVKTVYFQYSSDLNKREFFTLMPLCVLVFTLGLFPTFVLDALHVSCFNAVKIISLFV